MSGDLIIANCEQPSFLARKGKSLSSILQRRCYRRDDIRNRYSLKSSISISLSHGEIMMIIHTCLLTFTNSNFFLDAQGVREERGGGGGQGRVQR